MPMHDAERREDEVLGLEVAQDVAAGRAERAADADLARALLHPEAREPDDAERGDDEQRERHADEQIAIARSCLK